MLAKPGSSSTGAFSSAVSFDSGTVSWMPVTPPMPSTIVPAFTVSVDAVGISEADTVCARPVPVA